MCRHGGLLDVALVAGHAGNTQQAGFFVQDLVQLVAGDLEVVLQVVDHRGIQVAQRVPIIRPASGVMPIEVSMTLPDRLRRWRNRCQMAGDQLQALNRLLEELSGAVADILVARAWKAVAADAVLLVVLIGDGIHMKPSGMVEWNAVSKTATFGLSSPKTL